MILVAALPRPFAFVAKRELQQQFVAGHYLRCLGAEIVERSDLQRSITDAGRLAEVAQQGRSLVVFPEGTFVARPGLLPFHLGAFLAAVRAGVPVVPVAIVGSRELLPDGRWWPRWAWLQVDVCAPIQTAAGRPLDASELLAAAVRLREASHRAIVRYSDTD